MKYFNIKNKLLMVLCIFTMFNSLSVCHAAEESFSLLGAATLLPVKNINNEIYVQVSAKEGSAILRSDSKNSARAIKTLPNDYALAVLGSEYGWIYVQDDDKNKGYINASDLTFKNGLLPDNSHLFKSKGQEVVEYAKKFIGTPYVWGGTNLRSGVDCSGLVYSVYKDFGVSLSRSSSAMYSNNGVSVSKSELKEGDLIFFNTFGSGVSHVGMYVGNGEYIHASDNGVTITSLSTNYSQRTFVGCKRILV
ncbi:MAG: NlpC/P60 family protein [Lachnospirales bacterium]